MRTSSLRDAYEALLRHLERNDSDALLKHAVGMEVQVSFEGAKQKTWVTLTECYPGFLFLAQHDEATESACSTAFSTMGEKHIGALVGVYVSNLYVTILYTTRFELPDQGRVKI
jgi:hypothetical protein